MRALGFVPKGVHDRRPCSAAELIPLSPSRSDIGGSRHWRGSPAFREIVSIEHFYLRDGTKKIKIPLIKLTHDISS